MKPRVAIVAYSQETSSFTTQRTTLDTFRAYGLAEGPAVLENRSNHEIGGFLHELQAAGFEWEPCPVIHATAGAHGPLTAATRTWFEERITAGIRAAAPLDAVYLALHGAAAADDEPDTEGRLQELVRARPSDPAPRSCCPSTTTPTSRSAWSTAATPWSRTARSRTPCATPGGSPLACSCPSCAASFEPTIAWRKIPLITHQEQFLTAGGPMKAWFDRARAMERLPGVASASTFPMQPWLDVAEGGWACAVVTDGDPRAGRAACRRAGRSGLGAARRVPEAGEHQLRRRRWRRPSPRTAAWWCCPTPATASGEARPATARRCWPSCSGNGRHRWRWCRWSIRSWPSRAARAGAGGSVRGPLGRALDPQFGPPVEIDAEVVAVGGGVIEVPVQALTSFDMGTACLLRSGSIYVVVSEHTGIGGNHPAVYQHFGLDVADAKMVVVKTASNWQYYRPWTSQVIRADTPGPTQSGLHELDWKHLPRPIYPLDPLPSP